MSGSRIWLSPPHMGQSEEFYVKRAFDTNWIAPLGPNVMEFEEGISKFYDNKVYATALSSGTAAIHLGLIELGVEQGDYVLCQSFTFSGSANPIKYLGANPVFIDSESLTWNICPESLVKALEDLAVQGIKPKALIAVHLYGMPYLVEEIKSICDKYEVKILEDAAEAFGSLYKGIKCGLMGDVSILSFNGNKIITTSGGGALLAKNKEVANSTLHLATQAREKEPHYEHHKVGFNYRMSNVLAGIGIGQLEVLADRVKSRRAIFSAYKKQLGYLNEIQFLEEPDGFISNRWLTTILLPSKSLREKIRLELEKNNIESRPLWKPMHLQPVFSEELAYINGISEDLFQRGLCLPSGSALTESDIERIVGIIREVIL